MSHIVLHQTIKKNADSFLFFSFDSHFRDVVLLTKQPKETVVIYHALPKPHLNFLLVLN